MEYGSRKARGVGSFSLVESYGNGGGFGFGYGGEGGKGSNPVQDNLN